MPAGRHLARALTFKDEKQALRGKVTFNSELATEWARDPVWCCFDSTRWLSQWHAPRIILSN